MSTQEQGHGLCGARTEERTAVVLVGGNGGLTARYRDVAAAHGAALRHYEKRLPPRALRGPGGMQKVALVIIMVGMVSHPLREAAQEMAARDRAPIVYLRQPSVSALRAALAGLG